MKARTFSKIMKYNKNHDHRGRFSTSGAAVTVVERRDHLSTDISDAVAEQKAGKANSLSAHIGPDGKLSPEREKVHKKIINDILRGKLPAEGQPELRMMGGGPASGKSSVLKKGLVEEFEEKRSITIDPDDIKKRLPGFKKMAKEDEGAAAFYHEESSALAKRVYEVACDQGINVTYDGTGDGSINSVQKKIDTARARGYKATAVYVTVDTDEAVVRNQARYDDAKAKGESPRLVPESYVRSCHQKVTKISIEAAPRFDHVELWDNNGPKDSNPKLIATGGNGRGFKAIDQKAYDNYLKKAEG